MSTITIPKEYKTDQELIGIPQHEYEAFLNWRKTIREFVPTTSQIKALRQSRKNRLAGKTLSIHELKRKLGVGN